MDELSCFLKCYAIYYTFGMTCFALLRILVNQGRADSQPSTNGDLQRLKHALSPTLGWATDTRQVEDLRLYQTYQLFLNSKYYGTWHGVGER